MVNFDGEWELRIFYTSTLGTATPLGHVLKVDVNMTVPGAVGETFDDFTVGRGNGTTTDLTTITDEFMDLLRPCYGAEAEFGRAEIWFIPEGTYDATFYAVYELGLAGTNAGNNVLSQQTTFTFRTAGGGNGRIQLMESAFSGSLRQTAPFASTSANNLSNYVASSSSAFVGRDNTPFIARIHQNDGQNEVLWRKRNRL